MKRGTRMLVVFAVVLSSCGPDAADTVPTSTTPGGPANGRVFYSLTTVGTLDEAVDLVERSPDDAFFYVVSRKGTVEKWSRDGGIRTVVLDIGDLTTTDGERGLLGLDFRRTDGAWEAFASYTNTDGDTRIARFPVNPNGTFGSGPATPGRVILSIDQPYSNHNGGDIEVGADNMLYVAMGDGGSAKDPERRALDTSSLLGKVLRIDPTTDGYVVPPDNPYVGVAGAAPEIWSIGLRNPWRITFDDAGNLWVADVGQNEWEEVTVAPATDGGVQGGRAVNFGWSAWEGSHRFNTDQKAPDALMPVHQYPHDDGACSISGGAVGTSATTPGRDGWYFFGDYCSGRVTAIFVANGATQAEDVVARDLDAIVAVRAVSSGVFVLSNSGRVARITTAAPSGARP